MVGGGQTQLAKANAQKVKESEYQKYVVDLAQTNQAFSDMNRVWGNIRARKREIKALKKEWEALKVKCQHVLEDPTRDEDE